jgi:hypothetical protein
MTRSPFGPGSPQAAKKARKDRKIVHARLAGERAAGARRIRRPSSSGRPGDRMSYDSYTYCNNCKTDFGTRSGLMGHHCTG